MAQLDLRNLRAFAWNAIMDSGKRTNAWLNRAHVWGHSAAPLVLFIAGALIGAIGALIVRATPEVTPAIIGLVGVSLGGLIAASTNLIIARANRRTQIATATWPRRLETHQAAFAYWWRIVGSLHGSGAERGTIIVDAQEWWCKNCLYLSERSQISFRGMLNRISQHESLLRALPFDKDGPTFERLKANWDSIVEFGKHFSEDAGGHLSDDVLQELKTRPANLQG